MAQRDFNEIIRDQLNLNQIKKGSAKAKQLFKENTGIDLDQLQQNAQDQINRVSSGIEEAKTLVNNTISSAQQISLQNPFAEEPEPEPEPEPVEPEIEIGEDL
jgi:hypothetical protein